MINYLKTYKGMASVLFLFVFMYVLLRAYCTEPLHDEIATFYFYIYNGDFIGRDLVSDANNHWLNSILGYGINKIFGESLFLFRLPNVLSFPIYFFASYSILKYVKLQWQQILGLMALSTIPFVIEYFAYCRGYGIGIAFFMLALYALINYVKSNKRWMLILLFFSLWIAVFANLIFLNASIIVIGYLVVYAFANRSKRKELSLFGFLFILSISPFVFLAFKLKEAGAFYYGSLDGLWDVTGKSLSDMVFFNSGAFAFVGITILVLVLLAGLISLFNQNWKTNMLQPLGIFTGLFFGNILLILGLAFILKVNYPEDRTGMHLIPLFILGCIFLIDAFPKVRYSAWMLVFFPITFLAHISIHSSIYSPDQRMSYRFYEKVRSQMTDESTLASYHMNIWTWNWNESFRQDKLSTILINNPDAPVYDIILAKKNTIHNPKIFELYDTLAVDERTHDLALKIKKPFQKILISKKSGADSWVDWEYYDLYNSDSLQAIPLNSSLQVTIDFDLKTFTEQQSLQLVFQTFDKDGQQLERMFYPIGLAYRNQIVDAHLKHHFVLPKFASDTQVIKVYIWNKDLTPYEVKNVNCYLYNIKP